MDDKLPAHRILDNAAFVYFDAAPTYGSMNGAVQIELASRTLTPTGGRPGDIAVEFVINTHLRCSPAAALSLRDAIDAALELLKQPQTSPAAAAKLN